MGRPDYRRSDPSPSARFAGRSRRPSRVNAQLAGDAPAPTRGRHHCGGYNWVPPAYGHRLRRPPAAALDGLPPPPARRSSPIPASRSLSPLPRDRVLVSATHGDDGALADPDVFPDIDRDLSNQTRADTSWSRNLFLEQLHVQHARVLPDCCDDLPRHFSVLAPRHQVYAWVRSLHSVQDRSRIGTAPPG